jgi:hypothetical protein
MQAPMPSQPATSAIHEAIHVIRGERVMLDADLARLYGVKTERLNEQVRRNPERFPAQFMFRLTATEWQGMYPQNAGTLQRKRRVDRLPLAFTEHGCLMLSNVLKSARAVEVSVLIIQAFVRLRAAVTANDELARRVDELARALDQRTGRHDRRLRQHEAAILRLLAEIRRLTRFPEPVHREIGFTASWRDEPPDTNAKPGK